MSDLEREVRELKERMAKKAHAEAKQEARSWTGRTQHDLTALHWFFLQVAAGGYWIWSNVFRPISRFMFKPLRLAWNGYRHLWDKVVYYEDQYQNRLFSKTRAGIFMLLTGVFCWYLLMPLLFLTLDTGLYFATVRHNEVVYLTNSQEILPEENQHSVQGCHALPCEDANAVYYRIRTTAFNEVWSIVHGRGLFYPDYVAASVPVSVSRCTVTSYGLRIKLLMRGLDIYPDLLHSQCTPLLSDTPPEGAAQ